MVCLWPGYKYSAACLWGQLHPYRGGKGLNNMPPVISDKVPIVCGAALLTSVVGSAALAEPLNSEPAPTPNPRLGLGSYRFVDEAFGTLMTFNARRLTVLPLGMFPLKQWPASGRAINKFAMLAPRARALVRGNNRGLVTN